MIEFPHVIQWLRPHSADQKLSINNSEGGHGSSYHMMYHVDCQQEPIGSSLKKAKWTEIFSTHGKSRGGGLDSRTQAGRQRFCCLIGKVPTWLPICILAIFSINSIRTINRYRDKCY